MLLPPLEPPVPVEPDEPPAVDAGAEGVKTAEGLDRQELAAAFSAETDEGAFRLMVALPEKSHEVAARFVSSKPCTGVTVSEVAVPDVCVPSAGDCAAARVSAAVRSLFALDSLARECKKKERKTATLSNCCTIANGHFCI